MKLSRREILRKLPYISTILAPSFGLIGGCDRGIDCNNYGDHKCGLVLPTRLSNHYSEDEFFVWGANLIRGDDGFFHLFYSRWRKAQTSGFYGWVSKSEIAHAVSTEPNGPFKYRDTVLANNTSNKSWDSKCKHNPNIHFFENKYYLYYMGTTGSGDDYWQHRNNQQIGCAVSESINGPWTKLEEPVLRAGASSLGALMVSNPSVVATFDGRYVMFYKGVTDNGTVKGGKVSILTAESESPTGPFVPINKPVFQHTDRTFPFEDPYIFTHAAKYWAVLKDMKGVISKRKRSLVLLSSKDTIEWDVNTTLSDRRIRYTDGSFKDFYLVERPHVWLSNEGNGILTCAVSKQNPWKFDDAVTSIVSIPFEL